MAYRSLPMVLAVFLFLHCGVAVSSSTRTRPVPGAGAGTGYAETDRSFERAERYWRQRQQEASLRKAIESWEQVLTRTGDEPSVCIRLSRAYHLLSRTVRLRCPAGEPSDAHDEGSPDGAEPAERKAREPSYGAKAVLGKPSPTEDGEQASEKEVEDGTGEPSRLGAALRDEAKRLLARGREAAEKALDRLTPGLIESLLDFEPSRKTKPELNEQALAALYWWAVNLHEWSALQGFGEAVARQQEIRAAMKLCLQQSPGVFYAGPHRYFGSRLAHPLFSGDRDLERSRQHFEHAIAAAPGFLENRLGYAKYYAVAAQDHRTFEEQLRRVLRAAPDAVPEVAAENHLQRLEAEELLQRAAELFE